MKKIFFFITCALFFSLSQINMCQKSSLDDALDKNSQNKDFEYNKWISEKKDGSEERLSHSNDIQNRGKNFEWWKQRQLQRQEMKNKLYDLISEKLKKLVDEFAEKKSTEINKNEQKSTELIIPEGSELKKLAQNAQEIFEKFKDERKKRFEQKKQWKQNRQKMNPEERKKVRKERFEQRKIWQEKSNRMLFSVKQNLENLKNKRNQKDEILEEALKLIDLAIMLKLYLV